MTKATEMWAIYTKAGELWGFRYTQADALHLCRSGETVKQLIPVYEIERLTAEVSRHEDFLTHLINNLHGNPNIKQSVMIQWIEYHLTNTPASGSQETSSYGTPYSKGGITDAVTADSREK